MKSLSLPALLLAVVLATPACTYLEQASTEPPPLTWAGAVPPSASRPTSAPDTTDFAEPAETETPPALATPAPDPLPQEEPEAVEPEMEPEPDVFAEA